MASFKTIIVVLIIGILIFFPDVVFSTLLELMHLLFELLHLIFEVVELGLDHVIEHLLHTGLHETQVIVFYIMMILIALLMYGLWRVACIGYKYCKIKVIEEKNYRKEQLNAYWLHQSIMHKISVAVVSVCVVVTYLLFFM